MFGKTKTHNAFEILHVIKLTHFIGGYNTVRKNADARIANLYIIILQLLSF
jgi:hypothetical protein